MDRAEQVVEHVAFKKEDVFKREAVTNWNEIPIERIVEISKKTILVIGTRQLLTVMKTEAEIAEM